MEETTFMIPVQNLVQLCKAYNWCNCSRTDVSIRKWNNLHPSESPISVSSFVDHWEQSQCCL